MSAYSVTVDTLYPWGERQLPESQFPGFHPFNPSIHFDGSDWRCLVRNCNYHARGGHYQVTNGTIRTRNVMLEMDGNLKIVSAVEMIERDTNKRFPTREHGYEDARLFRTTIGGLVAIATTSQLRETSVPEMVILGLDKQYQIGVALPVRGGEWEKLPQKNWSPFDSAPEMKLLYSIDQGLVWTESEMGFKKLPEASLNLPIKELPQASPNMMIRELPEASPDRRLMAPTKPRVYGGTETKAIGRIPVRKEAPKSDWSHGGLRGSSQLIGVDGRWLGVGHEMDVALHKATGRKVYRHRFYNTDGARGPWFNFGHAGIEFCAGLAWDGERLVLSFGVDDCEAWIGITDMDAVIRSLA